MNNTTQLENWTKYQNDKHDFPGNPSPVNGTVVILAPTAPSSEGFRDVSSEMIAADSYIAKLFFSLADGGTSFLFPIMKTRLNVLF